MAMTDDDRTQACARLAEQNDAFRKRMPEGGEGQWVWTNGIDAEGMPFVLACFEAAKSYDDFTEDSDPYGTHEMGFMDVSGKRVWWKIDLYDRDYKGGSPDPTSLTETRRVLTVFLPSEN